MLAEQFMVAYSAGSTRNETINLLLWIVCELSLLSSDTGASIGNGSLTTYPDESFCWAATELLLYAYAYPPSIITAAVVRS